MAQALGIVTSEWGYVPNTLGLVNFGTEAFTGDPDPYLLSRSGTNPSTIWIAAGVDPEGSGPGLGYAGGIMPDVRVYSQRAKLVGKTLNFNVSTTIQ